MIEVKIGGKKRQFSFGLEVLGRVQLDSEIDLIELGEVVEGGNLFMIIKPLIFRSYEWELKKQGKPVDITLEDVDKWLKKDGVYSDAVIQLWRAFSETVVSYLPKSDNIEGEAKKK